MAPIDLSSRADHDGDGEEYARHVLLVGTDDWAVNDAASRLRAAGRTVHRCCDSINAPFPCNALIPERGCPLDNGPVEVVVTVRPRPQGRPGLGEMGAICGLRAGLPLVTAGVAGVTAFESWAMSVPLDGDLVTTCDEAVRRTGVAHAVPENR